MDKTELTLDAERTVLGDRAVWGAVGYTGAAHAPAPGTYLTVDVLGQSFAPVEDCGECPQPGSGDVANLAPLMMAAIYEVAFAWEAGPLTTWSN